MRYNKTHDKVAINVQSVDLPIKPLVFLLYFCYSAGLYSQKKIQFSELGMSPIRMSHHINTSANEYLPIPTYDGSGLIFSGMDRTGFFDFKLDFTKQKSAGGEDIFISRFRNGVYEDARPITFLNTDAHEVATHAFKDGSLLVVGNYIENLGPMSENAMEGAQTTDIFKAVKSSIGYQIYHFPEPLNSIFSEFDAVSNESEAYLIFASDRPGHIGAYHKKGWLWNSNFWGNTDIYVSLRSGYDWSIPINLGPIVNTPFAERSPWLSPDGKKLYISSNGHKKGKNDMDVYYFTRTNLQNWTDWQGPYPLLYVNSNFDEWGYKISNTSYQFFSRAKKLNFSPTHRGEDAGFRETNFRSNYLVKGAQSASFTKGEKADIFMIPPSNSPLVILPDVFFDFNSFYLKKNMTQVIFNLADLCMQNPEKTISIYGYTDKVGSLTYNNGLSLKRANSIGDLLKEKGVQNKIEIEGKGVSSEYLRGEKIDSKLMRRVEIYLN